MAVSSGELDRRITVQVDTVGKDAANDETHDWTNGAFKLWASKKQQRGFETVGSQELIRSADTVFEVRRTARTLRIAPKTHRIVHDGQIFTIVGIQEGKTRRDSLQILASSRPDGQGSRGRGNVNAV